MRKVRDLKLAFEASSLRIELSQILPLREVTDRVRKSVKFGQIAASIREVGIIEPPVVARDVEDPEVFHLLDGHLRIQVLKDSGIQAVVCLVATDDEAYTYNKRVNRLAIIQEHRMILTALQKGVSEERLARALNLNLASIRSRRRLLEGICKEAAELLSDKHVPFAAFRELRKMKPLRQIEAAELMVAMGRYSISYARSLVTASPADQLVEDKKAPKGLTPDQIEKMEQEAAGLQREFKLIEQDYGADHLDLVLATGYVGRLLRNARVVGYLARSHPEILAEFQRVTADGAGELMGTRTR
jgi:ParB-like chromosome segregation protein Spo0J